MPHGLPPALDFVVADEVSDLEWILIEVERIAAATPEGVKQSVVALLRGNAGKRLYLAKRVLVRPAQVEHAQRLLDLGLGRPQVRDALVACYGCCAQHAYQLINDALARRGRQQGRQMALAQVDLFRSPA